MNLGRRNATLVLLFDDGQMTALLANGESTPLAAPVAVDPLMDDPALAAKELRDSIRALGPRLPRRAVVGLGLGRMMAIAATLPAMPDEAVDGYLRIQAEREFLLPPEELAMAVSMSTHADGQRNALLAALPARQYANLQRALHLAGFSSVAVLPAVAALADPGQAEARLVVSRRSCDLLVTGGGGIVLMRRILGTEAGELAAPGSLDTLPADIRISLRQLPAGVRGGLKRLVVTGAPDALEAVLPALEPEGDEDPWRLHAEPVPAGPATRCCERLAALAVSGLRLPLVLAPVAAPRPRSWLRRWRTRHLVAAAAAVLALVLGIAAAVLCQRWRLNTVRREWAAMQPRVETLRKIVAHARSHGAWASDQPESLDILRAVTLAFPERGTVWATRLEIRGLQQVSISGKAAGREDWLRTLETLRKTPGVRDLRVSQARTGGDAKAPMTFAIRFTWSAPAARRTGTEETP